MSLCSRQLVVSTLRGGSSNSLQAGCPPSGGRMGSGNMWFYQNSLKQECIPVWCGPSTVVAICGGGGRCLCLGVVCQGLSLPGGGVCLPRGCLPRGGVHLPPVDRQTPVKNITFPQLLLRTAKTKPHEIEKISMCVLVGGGGGVAGALLGSTNDTRCNRDEERCLSLEHCLFTHRNSIELIDYRTERD